MNAIDWNTCAFADEGCTCGRPSLAVVEQTELEKLRAKVDELTAKIERRRLRLVEAEADLLNVRGILSPNGYPRRVPVDLVPTVAPAVQWLADRVDELTAALAERDTQLTTATRRADGLANDLRSATKGNTAWANQTGEQQYLIWSNHHQSWWGPSRSGYRANPADAGRYTLAAAEAEMTRGCHCCQVPEVPVAAGKAIGKGDQAIRDAITQATDWAVKAGQANKAYEPVTVELPAEAATR